MMKKYLKIIIGLLGAIMIGAIGSGIWERFLSPFSDSAISWLANIFSLISDTYADSLYERIGTGSLGVIGAITIYPYSIIQLTFLLAPITMYLLTLKMSKKIEREIERETEKETERENKTKTDELSSKTFPRVNPKNIDRFLKYYPYFILPIIIFLSTYTISNIVKQAYSYDVVIYIESSLEIISPKISDQNLKELKSEYRQINNKDKFEKFNTKLIKIANEFGQHLPEISILKIE